MPENNKFARLVIAILLVGLILRLRGFTSRFLLGSDTARDLLVAKGALVLGELPSVGSFSSSGPFVFAPNWYWFLMGPLAVFPDVFLAPWLLLLVLSILSILLMILAGYLIAGKRLALITGLIVAISPIAAGYATYLTQHGLVEFFSCLAVFGFVALLKTRKVIFSFVFAFALGCGLSLHYQVINLLVLVPLLIIADFWPTRNIKRSLLVCLAIAAGLILPLLPLILWDLNRGFQNTLHLIGYFRVGQYQIYVPNRWLTYVGVFWTTFLGRIFGGNEVMGGLSGLILLFISAWTIIKRKMPKEIFVLLIAFVIQFIVFRYFRGERYEGYVVYFHGILFLLIGWVFYELIKLNKLIGFAVALMFIFLSVKSFVPLGDLTNDVPNIYKSIKKLDQNKKYAVYAAKNLSNENCAFAFSWVLESQKLESDNGQPLAICKSFDRSCHENGEKFIAVHNYQGDRCVITELRDEPDNWYNFGKIAVFDDVQNWWKKESK